MSQEFYLERDFIDIYVCNAFKDEFELFACLTSSLC